MTPRDFPDTDAYFDWLGQQEAAELRRNPNIDLTLLMPWGGIFTEKTCQHIAQAATA